MRKPYTLKETLWQNIDLTPAEPTYTGFLKAVLENNKKLAELRKEMNIQLDEQIVLIAEIHDEKGTGYGYRLIKSGNIADCFVMEPDTQFCYYLDRIGDLRAKLEYEGGYDDQTFRVWKPGMTKQKRNNFLTKFCEGRVTRWDVWNYTASLGDYIKLKQTITGTETRTTKPESDPKPKQKRRKFATEEEREEARKKRFAKLAEQQKEKYRNDPEFREKEKVRFRKYYARKKAEREALKTETETKTA